MRQVAVRVSGLRYALVDLHEVNSGPWNVLTCKHAQHEPRRVAATDRYNKAAALGDRLTGLRCHDLSTSFRYRIGVDKQFSLHESLRFLFLTLDTRRTHRAS